MSKKQLSDMEGKMKALQFRLKRADEITAKGEKDAVKRQKDSVEQVVSTISELKDAIEEYKFAQNEPEEDIGQWSAGIEKELALADESCVKLTKFLNEIEVRVKEAERTQRQEETMEFEKRLLEQKLQAEKEKRELSEQSSNVSLPKIKITKFNGTPSDWVRFEGQFNAMVNSLRVPAITKFSHLKELVEPRVRSALDCLPFTEEGYGRALKYLKEKYGHPNEVAGSYVINLLELPCLVERDVAKIHNFYERLLFSVESLETLGKLQSVEGAAFYVIVKKLEVLKAELVTHVSGDWRDWSFKELLEALRKWTETNSVVKEEKRPKRQHGQGWQGGRAFASDEYDPNKCVYCDSGAHKASACDKITSPFERKRVLMQKKLCFNCASAQHPANSCKSKKSCSNCQKRHHTSICPTPGAEPGLTANVSDTTVVHPVVIVKVKGLKFRALLDSGASHSYVSSTLVDLVKATPVKSEDRRIATLMGTITTKLSQYDLCLEAVQGDFKLNARVTKINKRELLSLDNPHNAKKIKDYPHLRDIKLDDVPIKKKLPVHLILGANEYAKIRTRAQLRVGRQGEPLAEHTRFGWSIMAPGVESDVTAGFLAVNSTVDYEHLCALDVLGLADTPSGDQEMVHEEFREQLTRDPVEGWYETGLPWKGNHPPLPNNRTGSLRRLQTQVQKLRRSGKLEEYDAIIREQLEKGIVEEAPDKVVGREYYMPHRAVIREEAESTKMRVVYDCSARAEGGAPSLNDCLDPGPPLQNRLWDVLVRERFHSVALAGDMRKAFLQVRIREGERDALRFFWLSSLDSNEVQVLRFTRALFGMASSPFLLGGVIEQHLKNWRDKLADNVAEIGKSLYVDDLISGGSTVTVAKTLKRDATTIFGDAGFQLHKWHSNIPELESDAEIPTNGEDTFAKLQLSSTSGEGCKLLGLGWDKVEDTIQVTFPTENAVLTKRGVLAKLARIYDPLGLVSPTTLQGKILFREACEMKRAWDTPLSSELRLRWKKWESSLPASIVTGRTLAPHLEPIETVELHGFGDASGVGVAAVVYAVVHQKSGTTQSLVAAKARLAKKGLTIPRLELVAGHMAVNLVDNVRQALAGFPVVSVHCWLDSTVALHWIRGGGQYRQFVANRVRKIGAHDVDSWRYVSTTQNPADLGSRGGSVVDATLWWNGPEWLQDRGAWPFNPVTTASPESNVESKIVREVIAAVNVDLELDEFDQLLERHDLRKTLRICAWIARFAHNCRVSNPKITGPITTAERQSQNDWWFRRVQSRARNSIKFTDDELQLNLQPNVSKILECRGRIQGRYPIYLPDDCLFTEKFVELAHVRALHGGVALTMAKVRDNHWVPRLRQLVKKVIKGCWGCKRFQALALATPPPGLLPRERTEGSTAFEVIGVDFAGPIRYRKSTRAEGKAYLALYTCSLSRALHLEMLPDMGTATFLGSLKRLVARRGRPAKIFSDNGGTFVGAAKWLSQIRRDEKVQGYLADEEIVWRFNLSRAPWWGGQFERLVGLFKRAFFKVVGGGMLSWTELCEVVLEVETQLNHRPLSYVEDDIQLPLLTPASFLFQRSNRLPEQEYWREENTDLRKRVKYLRSCKDALWRRWTSEYLKALRERHNCQRDDKRQPLKVGEVVIVRAEEKNRGKWPLAIVTRVFPGKDGIVRAVELRCGKSFWQRPIQHLYPLELKCDRIPQKQVELDPKAPAFRSRRDAAVAANVRIGDTAQYNKF